MISTSIPFQIPNPKSRIPNPTQNFVVTGLCFSPDSSMLAVGQTDEIVFVYKIGAGWGERKTICNKFVHSSPTTSMIWPVRLINR